MLNKFRFKSFCQYVFIKSWGTITKLIPFICYMFLVKFNDLEYFYWSVYIFITFINILILLEVAASFYVLIKEGDTQIRYSDILNCKPVSQIPTDIIKTRLGVILIGYLPNEIDILPKTLDYLHTKMNLDLCHLYLCLVINGSKNVDGEKYQQFIEHIDSLRNKNPSISLSFYDHPTSTSKCDNVNKGIEILSSIGVKYIGMLDSDHFPHPACFDIIIKRFDQDDSPDIIQGRCSVRRDSSFLSKIVAAEYDIMYCVSHMGSSIVRGFSFFCGSNGWWKSNVLKDIKMNKNCLVEDIDSSFRAVEKGYKIVYCRDAISTEEAPPSLSSWKKQRTRWAIGWAQCLKHTWKMIKSKHTTLQQKIATIIILPVRELFNYVSFHTLLVFVSFFVRCGNNCASQLMLWMVIINFITPTILFYSSLIQSLSGTSLMIKISYPVISLFYNAMKSSIVMTSHGKLLVGLKKWSITPRKVN